METLIIIDDIENLEYESHSSEAFYAIESD